MLLLMIDYWKAVFSNMAVLGSGACCREVDCCRKVLECCRHVEGQESLFI